MSKEKSFDLTKEDMELSILDKNLGALYHRNSKLALKIWAIEENTNFEVFQGKDPLDINILDIKNESFFYANPINDTVALFNRKEELQTYPYRYFFGIGNGVLISMILRSQITERILVIEPKIELLYIVLNIFDFSKEIASGRLFLDVTEDINNIRVNYYLSHKSARIYLRLYQLEIPSLYYHNVHQKELEKIHNIFTETAKDVVIYHGNSTIDTLMGIENHFVNLPQMIKGPKFKSILNKKNAKTAVVVSTGPSLTKQIPLLKKIKDHITIISVDASFPILAKHGIKPDFVTALERVPETANFFNNNTKEMQEDVIFVFASVIDKATEAAIKAGHLMLEMRAHEYTRYFELDDFGYIGAGMSSANLAHELAISMKYEQVLLIGQDLAFGEDDSSHADDHFFGVNEESINNSDLMIEKYGGGGEVKTTFYWKLFKNFFETTIGQSKNYITTINCTEGGALIPGAVEMSFKDAIAKFIDTTKKAKKLIEPEYATTKEQKIFKQQIINKTNTLLQKVVQTQENIEQVFMHVQKSSEELIELNKSNQLQKIDFDKLDLLVKEIDTIKSLYDEASFKKMFYDVIQTVFINQELLLAKLIVENPKTKEDKQAKKINWIMNHAQWLFDSAGSINAYRLTLKRAIDNWDKTYLKHIVFPEKKEAKETFVSIKKQSKKTNN
jgi:hypothetical protein